MATLDPKNVQLDVPYAGEHGNQSVVHSQVVVAVAAINDVIRLAKVPKNSRLLDLQLINTAAGAGRTLTLGYESADAAVQVPAHFTAAKSIATASRINADSVNAPALTGDQDAYITGTLAGGAIAAATTFDVVVTYEYIGG